MARYFLGLISGTSVDGVDAAICEFGDRSCTVIGAQTFAYPPRIAERIQTLITAGQGRLAEIGATDLAIGRYFADCALALIRASGIRPRDVIAIGHHGQTIWHEPDPPEPFSWQLGDPNSIAAITGIDTVADLRRLDMALGGQGAPLVPAFHAWLFASDRIARVILNLGGIANLTVLVPGRPVTGFDTGPANTLLDHWVCRCRNQPFDDNGAWSASGSFDPVLLAVLASEPWFSQPPPKSTGRERFNASWLDRKLAAHAGSVADVNVAATILELSAKTIADAIAALELPDFELIVCGGGAGNAALMSRIGALTSRKPMTTTDVGLDPHYVEAAAMAWLAQARVAGIPGNLPTVTAAREAVVLGGLYSGADSEA
jgi:anhydro-N-acetylmuramic acid kinase